MTNDGPLSRLLGRRESEWRARLGIDLRVLSEPQSKSLERLYHELSELKTTRSSAGEHERIRMDTARAKTALERVRARFQEFVQSNLQRPSEFSYELVGARISIGDINEVETTARRGVADGERVSMTALVSVSIDDVRPFPARLEAGQRAVAVTMTMFMGEWAYSLSIKGIIALKATATFRNNNYEDIRFESAFLSSWEAHPKFPEFRFPAGAE